MTTPKIQTLTAFSRPQPAVSMVFHRPTTFLMRVPDAYKFRPKGLLAPLQRLAWVFLQRTHALLQHAEEQAYYTRITFDGDEALKRIMRAYQELFLQNGERPSKVMIGAEELAEIMRDSTIAGPLVQHFEFSAMAGYGGHVYGLPVEVIPHMRGVLVL